MERHRRSSKLKLKTTGVFQAHIEGKCTLGRRAPSEVWKRGFLLTQQRPLVLSPRKPEPPCLRDEPRALAEVSKYDPLYLSLLGNHLPDTVMLKALRYEA